MVRSNRLPSRLRSGTVPTALLVLTAIAIPISVSHGALTRSCVTVAADARALTLSASTGRNPLTYWSLPTTESARLFPRTTTGIEWSPDFSFATTSASRRIGALEFERAKPLGIERVGDCALFSPDKICPTSTNTRTEFRAELRSDGRACSVALALLPESCGVAGQAALVNVLRAAAPEVAVVATTADSIPSAQVIENTLKTLERRFGFTNEHPLVFVTANESSSASHFSTRGRFRSNLVLATTLRDSPYLCWRICSTLLAHSTPSPENASVRRAAAEFTVLGDLLQAHVFDRPFFLRDAIADQRFLTTLASLGNGIPTWLDSLGVVPEAVEKQGAEIDAPLLLDALLRRAAPQRIPNAELLEAGRLSSWITTTLAQLRRLPAADPFERADGLLASTSLVVPTQFESDATAPPTTSTGVSAIDAAADLYGFLEDCGCKASSGGGLKRILSRWAADSTCLHVVLGNVLALPGHGSYVSTLNAFLLRLLRESDECRIAAFVPGGSELYAVATRNVAADSLEHLKAIACNVRSRHPAVPPLRPFVDVRSPDGTTVRIIGVCELDARVLGRREIEVIADAFELADVHDSVAAIVKETLPGIQIVVCGMIHPASLRDCIVDERRPSLLLSGFYRIPRALDGHRLENQLDGSIDEVPVLFDRIANYGVLRVAWTAKGIVSATEIKLLDAVDESAAIPARIRAYLIDDGGLLEPDVTFQDDLLQDGVSYVGSARCMACHEGATHQWSSTHHANAMKSLEAVQRQHARACVPCHVVGFGARSGYSLADEQSSLRNVGCEVCHGPGSKHLEAPRNPDFIRRNPADSVCAQCHTEQHSFFLAGRQAAFRDLIKH